MVRCSVMIFIGIWFIHECNSMESKVPNQTKIATYERYVKESIDLDKNSNDLLKTWNEEFQLKQVNVTTKYRMMMNRHQHWSFRIVEADPKWTQCIKLYKDEIDKGKTTFHDDESKCLRDTAKACDGELLSNNQLGKEIKKWRRGYKYLKNLCLSEYPQGKGEFTQCVEDYVQKDKYNKVYERLKLLKEEAMLSILAAQNTAVVDLDNCLKNIFTKYLENARSLKLVLSKCYSGVSKD